MMPAYSVRKLSFNGKMLCNITVTFALALELVF